jgi:hypothetical protein
MILDLYIIIVGFLITVMLAKTSLRIIVAESTLYIT